MSAKTLALLPLTLGDVAPEVAQLLAQEGIPTISGDREAPPTRFLLCDRRRAAPAPRPGQIAIDLADRPEVDALAEAPWTTTHKAWNVGGLLVTERVARADRREVRRRLAAWLQVEVESRGGVWARWSPYPAGYRTAFNLRADYDGFAPDDFERFWSAIAGFEQAVTHFVCATALLPQPSLLDRLRDRDVGSHGWFHHSYADAGALHRNVERGLEFLRQHGIEPRGYAAPHGRWSPALAATLDELGVAYSSEFGCAHDDLPLRPPGSRAWQIPTHPVGLGVVLEAGRAAGRCERDGVDRLTNYWAEIAAEKHAAGEPIFLYDHPDGRLGRYPEICRALGAVIAGLPRVWATSLTEFAAWWQARSEAQCRVLGDRESLTIESARLPRQYTAALEIHDGPRRAAVAIDSPSIRMHRAELAYESMPTPCVTAPLIVERRTTPRDRCRQWLDWETETPVSEIAVDTWPGVAKRALRAWRHRSRAAA